MTRAFAVVNPAAGGGRTRRVWPHARDALRRLGADLEAVETREPGEATALARAAAERGWPLVVAVGGDGTLLEVVNGVAGVVAPAGGTRASVGFIPTGRGCDACRNLGIPTDPVAAARRLADGADVTLDLGAAEWPDGTRRRFVAAAGVGFDAAVARRAASLRGGGTVPYLVAVLLTLARHRPVDAEISVDGRRAWSGPLTAAVVANGRHYGGGMRIAPSAAPDDGRLDLVVLGEMGRAELLRWLPRVYSGGHLRHPRVVTIPGRTFAIRAAVPLPVHLDGEAAPDAPVDVTVEPGALRLRR
ncbi:MAG: diacylglycerol/lipid kinase family protein [Candidatus Rokuibacteriota bacterium]